MIITGRSLSFGEIANSRGVVGSFPGRKLRCRQIRLAIQGEVKLHAAVIARAVVVKLILKSIEITERALLIITLIA
jgi:hypothetical protein